jgi:hypothetical protein
MGVLSLAVASVAGAYLLPRAASLVFRYGMSGLGATITLWGVVALLYDIVLNADADDGFTEVDAAATLGLTLALRAVGFFRNGGL